MAAVTESWFSDDAIGDNERHNPGEVHHIVNESGNMAKHHDMIVNFCNNLLLVQSYVISATR